MCKRSDNDLLIRVLTDRYKLNILRLPRRGIGVGELLIREGKDLRCAGSVRALFDPPLDIPSADAVPLPDVEGVTSARRSAKVAGAPLIGMLTALGAAGVSSVGGSLHAARDVSVAYSLTGTQYRSTDLTALGDELAGRALRRDNALYRPGREFYIAYATAEATGIKVTFTAASDRAASFALEIAAIIKSDASADAATDQAGALVITSSEPVTFGIAVVQLVVDGESLRFEVPRPPRAVRGEEDAPPSPKGIPDIFFDGADGEALVEIT